MFYAITIICILLVLFLIRASKGRIYHIDELKTPINDLLKRGYDGGLLTITVKGTKDFIQLRKNIYNKNKYDIELSFPDLEWSKGYFPKLVAFCNENKVKCKCLKGEDGTSFLDIGFGIDTKKAFWVVTNILENIFLAKGQYYVLLENACRWDELVNSPEVSEKDISLKDDIAHIVDYRNP